MINALCRQMRNAAADKCSSRARAHKCGAWRGGGCGCRGGPRQRHRARAPLHAGWQLLRLLRGSRACPGCSSCAMLVVISATARGVARRRPARRQRRVHCLRPKARSKAGSPQGAAAATAPATNQPIIRSKSRQKLPRPELPSVLQPLAATEAPLPIFAASGKQTPRQVALVASRKQRSAARQSENV